MSIPLYFREYLLNLPDYCDTILVAIKVKEHVMINFENIPLTVTPEFKGGKGEFSAHMFSDELNKIFKGILSPSSSIGMHTHDTSSEIIFVLSGIGKVYTGDKVITLNPGDCHY